MGCSRGVVLLGNGDVDECRLVEVLGAFVVGEEGSLDTREEDVFGFLVIFVIRVFFWLRPRG